MAKVKSFFLTLILLFLAATNSISAAPSVSNITDNRSTFGASDSVPLYQKLEINFDLSNSTATNFQWPFDASSPTGVTPATGISIDAEFSNDNWQTILSQPAFFSYDYDYAVKNNLDWLYPKNHGTWKIRFSPNKIGNWQYRIKATDSSGSMVSGPVSFSVITSNNPGFVKVSPADSRYFEFDNGQYFPGLGYNLNFNRVSWVNPITENTQNFSVMSQNGIQLPRIWLSQWAIYGTKWNPWHYVNGPGTYIYLSSTQKYADHDVSLYLSATQNPCISSSHWLSPQISLKQNTNYKVRVRTKISNLAGPTTAGEWGLVAKITRTAQNSWLDNCQLPGQGERVGSIYHKTTANSDWEILDLGSFNSQTNNFLTSFNLVLENTTSGIAYVDHVWIEEDLGNNNFGPNVVVKPGMNHHQYFDERLAAGFDKLLDLATQYQIYLRPVVLEKEDDILWATEIATGDVNFSFNCQSDKQTCWNNFYGDNRNVTKVRWLQQAWWRYLQARWGYSPYIHSFELLNEGDPNSSQHAILADEFAKYMHQFGNKHLISTSNWTSFPASFWNQAPNVDFVDVHRYIAKNDPGVSASFFDTALATYNISMQLGAKQPGGLNKPIIRGETGFTDSGTEPGTQDFLVDTQALWLHNYIWAGINPGGLIESYWYSDYDSYGHLYSRSFDHRNLFGNYYRFIKDVPLNNGRYVDAAATSSNPQIRAWGQKDLTANQGHLWISNANHTWKNVADGVSITSQTSNISLSGFSPNRTLTIEWWNTSTGQISNTTTQSTDAAGVLTLAVNNLSADLAVKIKNLNSQPTVSPGDANNDGLIDGLDYVIWINHYGDAATLGPAQGDFNNDHVVDGVDYIIWLNNYRS